MISKLVVILIAFTMILLSVSPLNLTLFYLFSRILIQPIATSSESFYHGIPLAGVLPILFIFYALILCALKKGYSFVQPNVLVLYLFLLVSVISFFNTSDYAVSIANILKVVTGVAVYCVLCNAVEDHNGAKKVLYTIVFISVIAMLFGYYQYVTQSARIEGTRIDSLFGWCNEYGIFLCISFCATLMLFLQATSVPVRICLGCVLASSVLSMILAKNRGSWIAIVISLFVAHFGYRDKIKTRWIVTIVFAVIMAFSSMIIQRFDELNKITDWGTSENTFQGRVNIWKQSLDLAQDHILFGYGIGTSPDILDKYYKIRTVPHNDYVRLLLETGVFGVLFYMIFLSRELIRYVHLIYSKNNWYINFPLLVSMIYWIIISFTQNPLFEVALFPTFMALLSVGRTWDVHST